MMRLRLVCVAVAILLSICINDTFVDANKGDKKVNTLRASADDVKDHHRSAKILAGQRHALNAEHLAAGLEGAHQARVDLRQHVKEHQYGEAAKDAFRVVKRPVHGIASYARNQVVDVSSKVKHSSIVRALTPGIKTQDQLVKANNKLVGKNDARLASREDSKRRLRASPAAPEASQEGKNENVSPPSSPRRQANVHERASSPHQNRAQSSVSSSSTSTFTNPFASTKSFEKSTSHGMTNPFAAA